MQRYYTDVSNDAVMINNLQIKVKIARTSKGDSANIDATTFEIYNMSEETRKYAELEGAVIILKAGYASKSELPILYAGQIKSVSTEKSPPEVITRIVAGDAYVPQKNARISKYYPPSTPKAAVIKDIALSLQGVGEGFFATDSLTNSYFNGGYSASGKVTDVLSKLCKSLGYSYVIENNRIYISPKEVEAGSVDYDKLIVRALSFSESSIKAGSGKMNDNTKDLSNSKTTKAGYKFNIFLDGRVRTASYVKVTDGELAGVYKVTDVVHTLDWRGKDWNTEIMTEAAI